jgi:hypothetical protein
VLETGDIELTGYVASDADNQQVTGRLQALPDVGRINNLVAVMPPPLCDALDVLKTDTSAQPNGPGTPRVDSGGALGTYFLGQAPRIRVTATAPYDGYLYIDYIDGNDKYVIHLSPNEVHASAAVAAGKQVDIGADRRENYVMNGDPGIGLIIAISTPVPLFPELRPLQELDAKSYLAELRRQLQSLSAQGYQNGLLASYSVLTIRKKN